MKEITLDSLMAFVNDKDHQLTKQAEATELEQVLIQSGEKEMNKQAQEAGQSLAEAILFGLNKQANNVILETSEMKGQDDRKIQDTPRYNNTVTETAKALMARASSEGRSAIDPHFVQEAAAEGGAQTTGRDPVTSNLDKVASEALNDLVAEGIPFEEAVELIKEAQVNMSHDLEKAAAVSYLQESGVSFDDAIALVKQASEQETYSDLEKKAALEQLMEDGFSMDDAINAIQAVCQ